MIDSIIDSRPFVYIAFQQVHEEQLNAMDMHLDPFETKSLLSEKYYVDQDNNTCTGQGGIEIPQKSNKTGDQTLQNQRRNNMQHKKEAPAPNDKVGT